MYIWNWLGIEREGLGFVIEGFRWKKILLEEKSGRKRGVNSVILKKDAEREKRQKRGRGGGRAGGRAWGGRS